MVVLYNSIWEKSSAKTEKKYILKNGASITSIRQVDTVRSLQMLGSGQQEADTDGICLGHLEGRVMESDRPMLDKGFKPTKTLTKYVCQERRNGTSQSQYAALGNGHNGEDG